LRLILLGFGNVGQGLGELLLEKRREINRALGLRLDVVAVVDSKGYALFESGLDLSEVLHAKRSFGTVAKHQKWGSTELDAIEVIENFDADIIVEMTPTNIIDGEPGMSFIKSAFRTSKHVVSTNKGPFALDYKGVINEAYEKGLNIKFSGTVGGATPMIDFAKKCVVANDIIGVEGILNGTTNYILTKMHVEGQRFEDALVDAQKMGIAEADPSYDIEGIDAACKLTIIANSIMNRYVTVHDVETRGIGGVTPAQILDAKNRGMAIKLICEIGEKISVGPKEVPLNSPLCVHGTLNVIKYSTELASDFFLVGAGAGGKETATAVLRDIIDIAYKIGEIKV
jgi:homoserine dehydrogenase